jgi:2-aminoethylphosphonate-pyruvate transaminase
MSPIPHFTKAFPMILLIPGPVTTRAEVRAVMALDFAPWDNDFRAISRRIRARVRDIAGAPEATHTALPLQGCGHFGTEAALRSVLPPGGRILVPITGTYAERMVRLAREAGRDPVPLVVDQNKPTSPEQITAALAADPTLSHVGLVYSETSSGVIHDAVAIGAAVRAMGRHIVLDAVSAFGALPLNLAEQTEIDAAVFTTNKCLEGLPGLVFIIVRHAGLQPSGTAGSWSFDLPDLLAQTQRDGGGGFRFTPAAQVVASFDTALDFYAAEGGQPARLARYQENARTVWQGLSDIGLVPCLSAADQGPIVVNIHAPPDPAWSLQRFVDLLKAHGFIISNFYNTPEPSFRVGCIGDVSPQDMRNFVTAVDQSLIELGVSVRHGN